MEWNSRTNSSSTALWHPPHQRPERETYEHQFAAVSSSHACGSPIGEDRVGNGERYNYGTDSSAGRHGNYRMAPSYGPNLGVSYTDATPVEYDQPGPVGAASARRSHHWDDDGAGQIGRIPVRKTGNESISVRTIEVGPGEFLRLRGAAETWQAIECGFHTPCECLCCGLAMVCIHDADFVLCPTCRVVSPVQGFCAGTAGGVGLGFKVGDMPHSKKNEKLYATY